MVQKRQRARQEILESAHTILIQSGHDAVTLASVAGHLGMTKQSLYHYFSSKEALTRGLVTTLLEAEHESLLTAINKRKKGRKVLGVLIRAFYAHYVDNLDAFRTVYCQSQLYSSTAQALDEITLREEIHPRTRYLFDVLEDRLVDPGANKAERVRVRQLAFTAWTSVLGLMTMLSIAAANYDPVGHSEKALIKTLANAFDGATT
ncbi:MAG: TetR/AcrR family transcriptional regulator [Woeseiaceae bacterium]|nr:TetR/AcrR family transcriptional regulator [Woeseiaceae bacterium]